MLLTLWSSISLYLSLFPCSLFLCSQFSLSLLSALILSLLPSRHPILSSLPLFLSIYFHPLFFSLPSLFPPSFNPTLSSLSSYSLSASTLSCSSGSSLGSLTSSRGSLATTSSLGSTSSLSFTDIYLEQPELRDPDFQNKLETLLQEGGPVFSFRPSSSITTIHEHEVVPVVDAGTGGVIGGGAEAGTRLQALRRSETPRSMSSLSPRSSLSSLSPPCSPLVMDSTFLSGEGFAVLGGPGGLDVELHCRLTELGLDREEQQQGGGVEMDTKQTMAGEVLKGTVTVFYLTLVQHCQKSLYEL